MREILFKAKRLDNGEWVEGYLLHDSEQNESYIAEYFEDKSAYLREVDPETVCQFTGLTDKNGVKIFEGDVVKSYDLYGKYDGKGIVHWKDLFSSWQFGECRVLLKLCKYEVIDNIFDDPELMKGGAV